MTQMGLIEPLALIVGTVAGAMALPFVMESMDRRLERSAQRERHRRRPVRHTLTGLRAVAMRPAYRHPIATGSKRLTHARQV